MDDLGLPPFQETSIFPFTKPSEMGISTFASGKSLRPRAMSDRTTSNPGGVLCLEPRQSGQFGDGEARWRMMMGHSEL